MRRPSVRIVAAVLIGFGAVLTGQSALQPQDFAEGLSIEAPSGQAFFRIDVPDHVFSETAWPDLRDLAVFNASGEPVSFARVAPPPVAGARKRVALRSFRLESTTPAGAPRIELDSRDSGVQLRVAPVTTRTGVEYLLTVADEDSGGQVDRLVLDWQDRGSNWRQTVTVAVSSDLTSWRTIASARPILDLRTDDGERLMHHEISVDAVTLQDERYWRLTFGQGVAPQLTSVEGETTAATTPRQGIRLPTSMQAEGAGSAVYELRQPQPVRRLRITPQDDNSVLPLLVEGRETSGAKWRPIMRTAAYRVAVNGVQEPSEPVMLGGGTLQAVRLTPIGTSWGVRPPIVEIERDPLTIVANARGAGPFLLTWGSRVAADASVSFATLVPQATANGVFDIAEAREGSRVALGGPGRLTETSPAERAAAWQTTMVWVMLIGGAGALAFLAFRVWMST